MQLQDDDEYDSPPIILATNVAWKKMKILYRTTESDSRICKLLRPGFEPGIVALRGRNA